MQMADRETPMELEYSITGQPARPPIVVQPTGWARAGVVRDAVELFELAVFWHPATDRIKLEKPTPRAFEESRPALHGDPLYPTNPTSSKALIRPFTAVPGFRYTFHGMDYTADEAERLTAELGSIDGWTWRPASG